VCSSEAQEQIVLLPYLRPFSITLNAKHMAGTGWNAAAKLIKLYHSQKPIFYYYYYAKERVMHIPNLVSSCTGTHLEGSCQSHYITSVHQCQTPILLILLCSRRVMSGPHLGPSCTRPQETKLDGGFQPHYITSVHQCQTPNLFIIIMLMNK